MRQVLFLSKSRLGKVTFVVVVVVIVVISADEKRRSLETSRKRACEDRPRRAEKITPRRNHPNMMWSITLSAGTPHSLYSTNMCSYRQTARWSNHLFSDRLIESKQAWIQKIGIHTWFVQQRLKHKKIKIDDLFAFVLFQFNISISK